MKALLALVASVWFVQVARAQQFELQLQTAGGSITSGTFQLSDGSSNYLKIWDSLGHLQADWYVTIPASGGSVQVPTPLPVSPTIQYYLQYGATWLPISFAPQPTVALPSAFKLAFDEEFNEGLAFNAASNITNLGPSGPGGSRWIAHTPYGGDFSNGQFNAPGVDHCPFSTDAKCLDIAGWHFSNYVAPNGSLSSGQSSGLICSVDPQGNGFSAALAYWEAKIWMPAAVAGTPAPNDPKGIAGLWCAFWLNGLAGLLNKAGQSAEVDIAEWYSVLPTAFHTNYHAYQNGGQIDAQSGGQVNNASTDLSAGWHVYSCLINSDFTYWYLDGVQVFQAVTTPEMQGPLYVMLDFAFGGGWPLDISFGTVHQGGPSSIVYHMLCQYIRCWKRQ